MIELSGVKKRFATSTIETWALNTVDLTVAQADFVAITGPSGCGKSTLLSILGLIGRPTAGVYRLEGQDVTRLPERDAARRRRERIGFVFQQFNLVDELTVEENVRLALNYRPIGSDERRLRVQEAMDRVGIAHRAKHYPGQLSGGQQQRAAIARAVVGGPALLLADEPTGNLDSQNGAEVLKLLKELNAQGSTLIMVTHSQMLANEAHRIVRMLDGRIVDATASEHTEAA